MTMRLPSTFALQCFDASARLGSFTAAARALHLTQGGVSRQVINLEAHLGVRLLAREPNGLKLTEAGSQYLADVSPALAQLERAANILVASGAAGGTLSVSVPPSWASYWLFPRLQSFVVEHPNIQLNVRTHVGVVDFGRDAIDAAVQFCPLERMDDRDVRVMPLRLRPYANASWASQHFSARDWSVVSPVAMLQHITLPRAWPLWSKSAGVTVTLPAAGARFELMSMAMGAALAGAGVALLPDFLAQNLTRKRTLRCLSARYSEVVGFYVLRRGPVVRNAKPLERFSDWLLAQAS